MDVGEARAAINALLKRYEKFKSDPSLLSNEKQACQSLIVPLIRSVLGWDVDDPAEFKVEEQLIGKRIDYVVCADGISQFIVEAKAPTRDIVKDAAAYQQALDYGHGKNHPFAILTNFHHIIVLDCFRKTRHPTEAEIARIDLTAANDADLELLLLFEKGYWLSSGTRNALYAQTTKDRRATVDEELLEDMKTWREQLLRSLRKRESRIEWEDPAKVDQAEEEVQRMIDRLVFIAFCEDKGLKEPRLWELLEAKNGKFSMSPGWLWGKVRELFAQYDKDYDSSLFKKSRCDEYNLDDSAILTVLQALRAPPGRSAYNFASIEVDILGRVYENFIGHIQTGKKRFTEKEDKGKRKKEGIYYTPKYIVDYIVNNTVRVAARGKPFEEILKLKIVDPACGSGSFLLGAFGVLCEEAARSLGKKKGEDLSEEEKKRIMTSCIHGVDLDRRAVQIAELSLALRLAGKSRLPELSHNIRHGNSLIDDKAVAGYDAFDWKSEFPDVFKNGGFDVVVGNPPYVRFESLPTTNREYYFKNYKSAVQKCDLFSFFVEKGIFLLRQHGHLGFIISSSWLSQHSFNKMRRLIVEETAIVSLLRAPKNAFKDASVDTITLIVTKEPDNKKRCENQIIIGEISPSENVREKSTTPQSEFMNNECLFSIERKEKDRQLDVRFDKNTTPLSEICALSFGIMTGDDKKFTYKEKQHPEDEPVLRGGNVSKYVIHWSGEYVRYNPLMMKKHKATARPGDAQRFEQEKIIIKREGAGTITAAYDDKKFYTIGSTFILTKKNPQYDLKFVLGILNSRLMRYWYGQRYQTITQSVNSYQKIPIKKSDGKTQELLASLVSKIITLIEEAGKSKSPSVERINKEIQNIDSEIDKFVYDLYGLTDDEVRIVEGS